MTLLSSLDHVVFLCAEATAARNELQASLGRAPDWCHTSEEGVCTTEFRMPGGAIELIAASVDGVVVAEIQAKLDAAGPGFKSLVFAASDLQAAHVELAARGLAPSPIVASEAKDSRSQAVRQWRRFRCSDQELAGLKIFVIERSTPLPRGDTAAPSLAAIEVLTPDFARCVRLFGEALGLCESPAVAGCDGGATRESAFTIGESQVIVRESSRHVGAAQGLDQIGTAWVRGLAKDVTGIFAETVRRLG